MNSRWLFGAFVFVLVPSVTANFASSATARHATFTPVLLPQAQAAVSTTALPDPQEFSADWLTALHTEHTQLCAFAQLADARAKADEIARVRAQYNLPGACSGFRYYIDRVRCGRISCGW